MDSPTFIIGIFGKLKIGKSNFLNTMLDQKYN